MGAVTVAPITFANLTDLSALRYRFMKVLVTGDVVAAGAGDSAVGVLLNAPIAGEGAIIEIYGKAYVEYGDSINAGSNITSNADGKAVTAGGGDAVNALCLETGAAGDIRPVLLTSRTSSGTTGIAHSFDTIAIPVSLDAANNATLFTLTPGYAGSIESLSFVTTTPTTDTANSTCVISASIGSVAVTGGAVTLDVDVADADPDTVGKAVAGSAITGTNVFDNNDVITVNAAVTANAFADGAGVVLLKLKKAA